MRLKTVDIQMYRNFVEVQHIDIESDVTALIGKNESGKTTVLKALHRLKPANGTDHRFDLTIEYPRWRLARDRRRNPDLASLRPVSARFACDAEDLAAIRTITGLQVPAEAQLEGWRTYDNHHGIALSCPFAAVVRAAAEATDVTDSDLKVLLEHDDVDVLRAHAKDLAKDLREKSETLRAKAVSAFEKTIAAYQPLIDGVVEDAGQREALWDLIPEFFYFSDYSLLPGTTDLTHLTEKITDGSALSDGERSVVALLAHAGEAPADFLDEDYNSRKAELQAASGDLSGRVFAYWRQNEDLDVVFDTDNVVVREDVSGNQVAHRILRIELQDGRHGNVQTNFATRSTGFQWFFSFFAAFSEYQDSDRSIIVLLDEPGTSLHGDAQRDFVRFIYEELGGSKQTIYTTHSQHMVDPTKYEKLRAVDDRATRQALDSGVAVTPVDLSADRSTILPVESALGYSVSQHLFLGSGQHLLVEGSSDFIYLQHLTEHLLQSNHDSKGLDPRLALLPVGGVDNMPAFVALLGRQLKVTALIDGARTNTKLDRVRAAARHNDVEDRAIIAVSEIDGVPANADIEDLFAEADYLQLYNWTFGTAVQPADLPTTTEPIVKRLTDARGKYDHALPAHTLSRRREEFFADVASETIGRFVAMFRRLNDTVIV